MLLRIWCVDLLHFVIQLLLVFVLFQSFLLFPFQQILVAARRLRIGGFHLQELQQIVWNFQSTADHFQVALQLHRRRLRPALELAFLHLRRLFIISEFVLHRNLLKWQLLFLRKVPPPVRNCPHNLSDGKEWEPLANYFPEFLAEINIGRKRLLRLVLRVRLLRS